MCVCVCVRVCVCVCVLLVVVVVVLVTKSEAAKAAAKAVSSMSVPTPAQKKMKLAANEKTHPPTKQQKRQNKEGGFVLFLPSASVQKYLGWSNSGPLLDLVDYITFGCL